MNGEPAGYDREWIKSIGPRSRLRVGYGHERGRVTRFVIQLEYNLRDEWVEVIRADHDETGEMSHDVSVGGVHVDVFRGREKYRTEEIFPPTPADTALTFAEEHLTQHAERYVKRYEEWLRMDRKDR